LEVFALGYIFTPRGNFEGFETSEWKLINMPDIQHTKTNSQQHNRSSEAKDCTAVQEILFLSALTVELPCLHGSRTRKSCNSRVLTVSFPLCPLQ
jgi:hypothetical protein